MLFVYQQLVSYTSMSSYTIGVKAYKLPEVVFRIRQEAVMAHRTLIYRGKADKFVMADDVFKASIWFHIKEQEVLALCFLQLTYTCHPNVEICVCDQSRDCQENSVPSMQSVESPSNCCFLERKALTRRSNTGTTCIARILSCTPKAS